MMNLQTIQKVIFRKMNTPTLCQYIFVPKKPRMSKGKIASQVSKVAVLALESSNREQKINIKKWIFENGMMTIVLQVKNQIELQNVRLYLEQEKIMNAAYHDEGYTEVPPGTMTAIATGIIDREKDGWRFEKYKLFR